MGFSYVQVKREVALRLAQLAGSDSTSLGTAYTAYTLDGAEVPAAAIKSLVLMIEKEIAQTIANNPAHPARSLIYARTTDLANLALIPTIDNASIEFVGVFDSAADSSTNAPLTLQPTQTLADVSNSFFDDTELFYYNLFGNQFRHSRPLAYLQGCSWSYTAQSTAYDADGDSPLPQVCANMLVNGVVGNSVQVGWSDNVGAAQMASQRYQSGLEMFNTGMPNIPLASQANSVAG